MELQFKKKPLECLQCVMEAVRAQEQTQEVKLPEAMPDVAKVLGTWGQCVLRGKEWRGGYMGASGGVTVWVLYAPEDGTFPRVVETWIPWQLQWDLPQTQHDGTMLVQPQIKSVDARAVSARKLMVRVCVEATGEALEPMRLETGIPEQLPDNIYLLRKKYPVCIPSEAGEKTLTIEEELQLPADYADGEKLIYYSVIPQIQEQKLLGKRLLFRGTATLKGLCRNPEGKLYNFSFDVPCSQYADLDNDWGTDAVAQVVPVVTDLELELLEGGKLQMKTSLVGQYLVCRKALLEVVEDAYSPGAQVKLQTQPLMLPTVLETERHLIQTVVNHELPAGEILDTVFYASQPEQTRAEDQIRLNLAGAFQVLYLDPEQGLQSASVKWGQTQQISADANTELVLRVTSGGCAECARTGNGLQLRSDLLLERRAICTEAIPMVMGLEVSPLSTVGPRPGVILRRADGESLWDMAKSCGSTEVAIRQANGLTEEPEPGRMLLIPVI